MSSSVAKGQSQAYLDSLVATLDTITLPIKKAEVLNKLAVIYGRIDLDKAISYAQRSLAFVPKEEIEKRGHVYNTLGGLFARTRHKNQAINHLDTAISLYKKIDYQKGLAMIYGNIGAIYAERDEFKKALSYIQKSMAINEKLGNQDGVAHNLTGLISINFVQKDFEVALVNGKKALSIQTNIEEAIKRAIKDDPKTVSPYIITQNQYALAQSYLNLAKSFAQLKQADSTIWHYNESLKYYQKIENKEGIAFIYEGLGLFYKKNNQPALALEYIQKALELEQYINFETRRIILQNSLASIYLNSKDYEKSIEYYQKALDAARKADVKSYQKDALYGLAESYAALGSYKTAFRYEKQFATIKDSVLNETKQKQLKELEIKYETNKKEQANIVLVQERDIERLKNKRNRLLIYAFTLVLILVLLASYFFLRANKAQSLQQTTQLKHQLLRNQMSPHFIFNALIAIQSFMYKSDVKEAGRYLSSFARLVRAILENSRSEYITLEKEIQWLENYLKLQLLRFDGKFEYDIIIDLDSDTYSILIPPMLTQPFIENALEHGLKSIDYKGKLEVVFKIEDDLLKIEVMDNGIGIEKSKTTPKDAASHTSLATVITEERLSFLNKKRPQNIYFNIKPLSSGTLVTFSIPLKYI